MEELELRVGSDILVLADNDACRDFTVKDLIGADFRMHYTEQLDTEIAGSSIRLKIH